MVYTLNQPVDADDLSISSPILRANTNQADTSFGTDHYNFSDNTANNGLHKRVTTVPQTPLPTTGANPILTAFSPSANVGAIHYSCGPNKIPGTNVFTPLTTLQSPSTPISLAPSGTTPIVDVTGLSKALFRLIAADYNSVISTVLQAYCDSLLTWNGTNIYVKNFSQNVLSPTVSGNNILLFSNSSLSNVYWTLQILRVE